MGSLTAFGMREVSSEQNVLKGSVFHRLFQRAFPGYFNYNSVHLWEPFYTPAMNIILARDQKYLPLLDLTDLEFGKGLNLPNPSDPKFQKAIAKKTYDDLRGGNVKRILTKTKSIESVPEPIPVTKTSNYNDIRNKILGKNITEFQNPSVLDKEVIPSKDLQDMLTGKSKHWDVNAGVLRDLVTEDTQKMFLEYFIGISKEITDREKRKFQTLKLTSRYFAEERRKLGILNLPQAVLKKEYEELDSAEKIVQEQQRRKELGKSPMTLTEEQQRAFSAVSDRAQVYQIDVVRE